MLHALQIVVKPYLMQLTGLDLLDHCQCRGFHQNNRLHSSRRFEERERQRELAEQEVELLDYLRELLLLQLVQLLQEVCEGAPR
jgi:hypothetical protein